MYLYSYPSTPGIIGLAAGWGWEQFEVCLKMTIEWTQIYTWGWLLCELTDALGGRDRASLEMHWEALGRPYWTQLSTFPQLRVNQWIESQLPLHLPPDRLPPDQPPPSTPPIAIDHGLHVHLQPHSITASKCISKLAQSRPPSASLSYTISAFKCIFKLARSGFPSASLSPTWSLPPSASLSYSMTASKCISKPARSWPSSASLSYTISASTYIAKLAPSRPSSASLSST